MQTLHDESQAPAPMEPNTTEMVQVSMDADPDPVVAVVGIPADQMGTPIAQKLVVDLALLKVYNTYKGKRRCLMWYSIAGVWALVGLAVLHCFVFLDAWKEIQKIFAIINMVKCALAAFIVITAYRCFKEIMPEENRVRFHHRRYKLLGFITVLASLAKLLVYLYYQNTGYIGSEYLSGLFIDFTFSFCLWSFVFWFVHEHLDIYTKNRAQFEKLREENPALFIV